MKRATPDKPWYVDLPVAPEPLKVWTQNSYPTKGEYLKAIQECMATKYGFHEDRIDLPAYLMYIEMESPPDSSYGTRPKKRWAEYTLFLKVGCWLGCKCV